MVIVWKLLRVLSLAFPYLLKSARFNFHYFPFKQAIRFPVLFFSRSSVKFKGKCVLDVPEVKFGMITFGQNFHIRQANTGFLFFNQGTLIFKGQSHFGHSCSMNIGEKGTLEIGDNVLATYGLSVNAFHHVQIKNGVRIGWNTVIMDTSFHTLKMLDGRKTKGYGPIYIGNNIWISSFCKVFQNTVLPDYCIVAAGSFVNKDYSQIPPYSMLAGSPLTVKKTGIYIDLDDDKIDYE